MARFLENMQAVLRSHPRAVWLVDMVSRQNLQELFDGDPSVAHAVRSIFASTDRQVVRSNPFLDDAEVHRHLAAHNLQVVSQDALSSTAAQLAQEANQDPKLSQAICGSRRIWTIRAAG